MPIAAQPARDHVGEVGFVFNYQQSHDQDDTKQRLIGE
jgi:hypothetical protein